MPKVGATVDWGLELAPRKDLFGETWPDGILKFGKFNHLYLSDQQVSRWYLAWLFAQKEDEWPENLLDRLRYWGERKSEGKEEEFDELLAEQRSEQGKIRKGGR